LEERECWEGHQSMLYEGYITTKDITMEVISAGGLLLLSGATNARGLQR
jgi:hypothetical protein